MSLEGKITWVMLRNIATTLDSYRIRVLIDAREDILNSGIYNEEQYYNILFKMFEDEQLKYLLYNHLNKKNPSNLDTLKEFSRNNSLSLEKKDLETKEITNTSYRCGFFLIRIT